MAKRKVKSVDFVRPEEQAIAKEAPVVGKPVKEMPTHGGEGVDYKIGKWNGREQYLCAYCAFDSLLREELREHLFWMHSVLVEE